MKHLQSIIVFSLFFFLVGCYGTESKTSAPNVESSTEYLVTDPSAKITHEDGWTIVSKMENDNRVYWFLAPEVDNVSPAMFKKIVYTGDKSGLESKTVSECEAPKQTCDDLMATFKAMSEKYN